MTLHDRRTSIDIDHQSGQRIALAVHQPITIGLRTLGKTQRTPHVVCHGKTKIPPRLVDGLPLERKHPHGNGTDLIMPLGDELSGMVINLDQCTLSDFGFVFSLDVIDGTGEDPRMPTHQRLLLTPFEYDSRYHFY